jgi:3-hydroxyisobutyrate dehydrogenase-like beta-hydroxyacid dehydrogenase
MDNSPIGLIGVGLLGTALAERMLAGGFSVLGFDSRPEQLEGLTQLGGQRAESAAAVLTACPRTVLCLPDSQVVAAVVEQAAGALRAGNLLIDATTGDPEQTAALAARLKKRGVGYVDTTIAGSSQQVREGSAVVMIGGDAENVTRAEPILASWSKRRFHVGPAGSGARLKLVVNLVLGLNRAVLAEGLALARACGIDPANALDVLKATPAHSAAMETKGPKMVARDYAPQAKLAQHAKDVGLIRALARRHGQLTPLSDLHAELLARAIELGFGEADNSAILEAWGGRNSEFRTQNSDS